MKEGIDGRGRGKGGRVNREERGEKKQGK